MYCQEHGHRNSDHTGLYLVMETHLVTYLDVHLYPRELILTGSILAPEIKVQGLGKGTAY